MKHGEIPVHYAPDGGEFLCGALKVFSEWTTDKNEVTCPECLKRIASQGPPKVTIPKTDEH